MSGFAGIINFDEAPVDAAVLEQLAHLTARHGSAPFHVHSGNNFGFTHSLLPTTPESRNEKQPFSFDNNIWIVGDVRVDARNDLVSALQKHGRDAQPGNPDVELVLHSYYVWGIEFVDHLLGDFAFAIWDSAKSSLVCARDHFGIKPFYYSCRDNAVVFSNDLQAVKDHPAVSDQLHDSALCDYLAFGYNLDEKTTCFSDINRIPPGHTLKIVRGNKIELRRFRKIDVTGRISYRDPRDYTQHFMHLFSDAVNDRLRTDRVTFELSGGLDSTSVAAMAAGLNNDNEKFSGLGITTDSSAIFPDNEEAHYAALAANECNISHATIAAGREEDFYAHCATAQPYAWPFASTTLKFAREARQHSNVLLGGQMGDVLLQGSGNRMLDEYRDSTLPAFALNRIKAVFEKRSLRALGIRTLARKHRPLIELPPLPNWLKHDLLEKSGSVERWKTLFYSPDRFPEGCQAELANDEMNMPFWSHLFESYYHDLLCGIDCRQPFLDLRLIEFAFSIPASAKQDKTLLRNAMDGILPEPVRTRPKTNVPHDLVQTLLSRPKVFSNMDRSLKHCTKWITRDLYQPALRNYAQGQGTNPFTILCPLGLERWICAKHLLR